MPLTNTHITRSTHHKVPFFGNPNGVSCGQCVYKMVLSCFEPEGDWSFARMNDFCGAIPGKYTWPYKPLIELSEMGFDIVSYSTFNTNAFIQNPEDYLTQLYGAEGCHDNISNSDMPSVLAQAKEYLEHLNAGKIKRHNAHYNADDLRKIIDGGYLAVVWVNSARLNEDDGYTGHFILVHDYDEHHFIAHDPGGDMLESQIADRLIKDSDLIAAASPRVLGETSSLIAIKRPNSVKVENAKTY